MANNYQTIESGEDELKDFYTDSTYEALKKRRQKAADKAQIQSQLNDQGTYDVVPRPDAK